jgi:anti-sigma regulatory factor (Ser/Thr protein kinase)
VLTTLGGTACARLIDTVALLTSELVTNAFLHGSGEIGVTVSCEGPKVRVEVTDRSDRVPRPQQLDAEAATGRGMLLVDALSTAWGSTPDGSGKVVWFEVDGGKRG